MIDDCYSERFSNVTWTETEISPTLENAMGAGGNNTPMIVVEKDEKRTSGFRVKPKSCNDNR